MRRLRVALLLVGLLFGAYLVAATESATSWSDGVAGSSGSIPIHLRKCTPPFKYCKVKVSGCGGCHGDWDAMQVQRSTEQPVVDRIDAEIWLNGRESNWEYEPGKTYVVDIYVRTERDPGFYNTASFDLNVSAGRLELFAGDDTLRITGGNYQHAGSKNPNAKVCHPQRPTECQPYGASLDDEQNWSGELTTTAKGSNISRGPEGYHWRAKWMAPPRQEPRGAAFVMAFMVPNEDGWDSCTYVECNVTKGYSDQNLWDWWSFMIPRKIVCEKGQVRSKCEKNVLAFILPPSPPLNTGGADGDGDDGGVTPIPPGETWVGLLAAALLVAHRARKGR